MSEWNNKIDLSQTAPNLTQESFERNLRNFILWYNPGAIASRRRVADRRRERENEDPRT